MLSETQKTAFRLQQLGYRFMPQHPITWDDEYKQLKYSKSKYSIKCFLMSLILNGFISFGATYTIFTHFFVSKRENYHAGIIGMEVMSSFLTAIPVVIAFAFSKYPECLLGINALFKISPISKSGKMNFKFMHIFALKC